MRNEETHRQLKLQEVRRYWLYASLLLTGLGAGLTLITSTVRADTQKADLQTMSVQESSRNSDAEQSDTRDLTNETLTQGEDSSDRDSDLENNDSEDNNGSDGDDLENLNDAVNEERTADDDSTTAAVTSVDASDATNDDVTPSVDKSDFTFSQDTNGNYTVTGYTGAAQQQADGTAPVSGYATAITIPDTYLGKPVIAIGANAFNNDGTANDHLSIVDALTAVTFGRNLQWIEAGAFANNDLTTISFSTANNLWSVGANAFENNRLTDVDLNQVAQINTDAFKGNRLTTLVIPEKTTNIAEGAFADNSLTQLTLGSHVETVGTRAFADNLIAGTLVLPAQLTELGDYAFKNNHIQAIVFNTAMMRLTTGVFENNQLAGRLTLPMGLLSVGASAFQNNQLTGIELGNALETIGEHAFANNRVSDIQAAGRVKISIGNDAFGDQSGSLIATVRTTTTTALGAKAAIIAQLGLTNLDLAGLQFTYNGDVLAYNEYEDILTLPKGYNRATITLALTTNSLDTGTYGATGLVLTLTPIIVKANLQIPSTKDGRDWTGNWVTDITGQLGATMTIAVPQFKGYKAQPITVKATVNADGTITTQDRVVYTKLAAPTTGGGSFGGGEDLGIDGESGVSVPTTGSTGQQGGQTRLSRPSATKTTIKGHVRLPQGAATSAIQPHRFDVTAATTVKQNTWLQMTENGDVRKQLTSDPDGIRTTSMTGTSQLPESLAPRTSASNAQPAKETHDILPQTNEQRSVWQWVGVLLLAGLSWLGFDRRKQQD